jgi:hypothetical protein
MATYLPGLREPGDEVDVTRIGPDEYELLRRWAADARRRHEVARQERKRRRALRRRWAGRLIIGTLVVVLGVLAWYRFGDPTALASVQR